MLPQPPGRRVALAGALLALGGHRRGPAGRRDPVVGVAGESGRVDVDGLRGHEAALVHQPDAVVVRRAPDAGVRGDRNAELARDLEGSPLRERRVTGHVERHLETEHVVAGREAAADELAELRCRRPLPRTGLDVAVGQDEPAGNLRQRIDRRLGVLGRLQTVRPVHRCRHAGVDRLDRGQQVTGVDVLRPEYLAPLQVVPDEVLGQRPVGAVAAHRGLPHVPVRVDHAGHHDAAAGVDLRRALRDRQPGPDRGDLVAGHQDVGSGQDRVRVVHGENGPVAQHDGPAGLRLSERGLSRHGNLHGPSGGHGHSSISGS